LPLAALLARFSCIALLIATGCSSGGSAVPSATSAPALRLSNVTVTCGTATVFGPASVSVNLSYGAGSALPLTASCPEGSSDSVSFTPSTPSGTFGPNAELVFNLLPSSTIATTAVAAADATGFPANTPQTGLAFSTPSLGAGTYLYVWLTQLQPQGD
jgi:hypothetical protein